MAKATTRGTRKKPAHKATPPKRSGAAPPAAATEGLSGLMTLAAVRRLNSDVGLDPTQQKVLHSLVAQAVELLRGDGGGFYLADPARRQLRSVVAQGSAAANLGKILAYGEGAAGKVAENGEPLNIEDYSTWPGRARQFDSETIPAV